MGGLTKYERDTLEKLLKKHGSSMTEHFNGLSESEHERLSILMEECGEVQQVIGKIMRHGYESYNPNDINQITNRNLLEKEIADIGVAVNMMELSFDINRNSIDSHYQNKKISIRKYLHHQDKHLLGSK